MKTKTHFRMSKLGITLSEDFNNKYNFEDACSCGNSNLCAYCRHPGNPTNMEDNDLCWTDETIQVPDWSTI